LDLGDFGGAIAIFLANKVLGLSDCKPERGLQRDEGQGYAIARILSSAVAGTGLLGIQVHKVGLKTCTNC
jgi:hypothetical protein